MLGMRIGRGVACMLDMFTTTHRTPSPYVFYCLAHCCLKQKQRCARQQLGGVAAIELLAFWRAKISAIAAANVSASGLAGVASAPAENSGLNMAVALCT